MSLPISGAIRRDIDDNREGRLAPAQAEMLRKLQRGKLLLYMAVPLVVVQIAVALFGAATRARNPVVGALEVLAAIAVLAATVVFALRIWQRASTLPHQRVTAIDGRVAWLGPTKGWALVDPSGVTLNAAPGGPLLPPGPFRFYLHDDTVVGAESPLDPAAYWSIVHSALFGPTSGSAAPLPVGDPAALQQVIAQTLGFAVEDLAHHRRGLRSPLAGAGRMVALEGLLHLGWRASRTSVTYWWTIGGQRVEVPLAWLSAVPPGVVYRIYLDEQTRRPVSLEVVSRALAPVDG